MRVAQTQPNAQLRPTNAGGDPDYKGPSHQHGPFTFLCLITHIAYNQTNQHSNQVMCESNEVKDTLFVAHIQLEEWADSMCAEEKAIIFQIQTRLVDLMNRVDALTYNEAS